MRVPELKRYLLRMGANTDNLWIRGDRKTRENRVVIDKRVFGAWRVYFSERGVRSFERTFSSERAAVAYFLELAERDSDLLR